MGAFSDGSYKILNPIRPEVKVVFPIFSTPPTTCNMMQLTNVGRGTFKLGLTSPPPSETIVIRFIAPEAKPTALPSSSMIFLTMSSYMVERIS